MVICDAETFVYRAFYEYQKENPWYTSKQSIQQYWWGFRNELRRTIRRIDKSDARKIAVFGCSVDTFRRKIYPEYKARRINSNQIPFIQRLERTKKLFRRLGFETITSQPGYEADDLIASICKKEYENVELISIHTFDTDLFQLINKKTHVVFYTRLQFPEKTFTYNNFRKLYYGYSPEHIPTLKAMCGDWTDGIPKVIETKYANAIIRKYNDVDNIFKNIDKLGRDFSYEVVAKIISGKDIIYRNLKLTTLKDDLLIEK